MKRWKWAVLSGLILLLCLCPILFFPGQSPEARARRRCEQLAGLYRADFRQAEKTVGDDYWHTISLSREDLARFENTLARKGCTVLLGQTGLPEHLSDSAAFRSFWERAERGQDASFELARIADSGALLYSLFRQEHGARTLSWVTCRLDEQGRGQLGEYEIHPIYDWELTPRDHFYYSILPEPDRHLADYAMVRLTPPDGELSRLTEVCVRPLGYAGVNLFLTDWEEGSWGPVSFNDLFSGLYCLDRDVFFGPSAYPALPERGAYAIPGALFEETILPHFALDRETLRALAGYDAPSDSYPWRPLWTDDALRYWYPVIEPEVTACRDNGDGTLTLTVEVLSTDLKTDCLFSHELTVRPLGKRYQYVSNRVTSRPDIGLPRSEPRLDLPRSFVP